MKMVAAARIGMDAATPETPDAVDPLDAVEQAGFLQSCQSSIQSHPVQTARPRILGDLLVGQGPVRLGEDLQHNLPSPGSAQAGRMK